MNGQVLRGRFRAGNIEAEYDEDAEALVLGLASWACGGDFLRKSYGGWWLLPDGRPLLDGVAAPVHVFVEDTDEAELPPDPGAMAFGGCPGRSHGSAE